MIVRNITKQDREQFNSLATHPLQSYEWGEFREKTGVKVIRKGFFEGEKLLKAFQLTIHPIPHTKWAIGYLPKGYLPDQELIEELTKTGKEERCVFIQLEPNIVKDKGLVINYKVRDDSSLLPSARPLFTKYTLQLDLAKSEDELLKNMHPKTRYNIKLAQKHRVKVEEVNSDEAFATYWKLMEETTQRQQFFAHTKAYHEKMWETLKSQKSRPKDDQHLAEKVKNQSEKNKLKAHLFLANYTPMGGSRSTALVAWVLFSFHDTLYYPYGASSSEYKNVMAPNVMMWEAIRFGKRMGLKIFDMWGSMGPDPDSSDPWYGFHRFKLGYGSKLVEFIGSYDLVINLFAYQLYKTMDKLRWVYLKMKR